MQNRRPRSATASPDAGVARPSSQESVRHCLHEPAVDDVALVGNRAGVVCGQEEGEPGNFLRLNLVLQRLALKNVGKVLGCVPELLLPMGQVVGAGALAAGQATAKATGSAVNTGM